MPTPSRRLVLLGGGHAHVQVLRAFQDFVSKELQVTLVTPEPVHTYSGMVPGVIAGHYRTEEAQIHLEPMARAAAATLIPERAVAIDPARRMVTLEQGRILEYDLLSINVGSVPRRVVEQGIAVKPFEPFMQAWQALLKHTASPRVAMVGGGAAGVELAMAMAHQGAKVTLFSDRNEFAAGLRPRLQHHLEMLTVEIRKQPFTAADAAAFEAVFLATGAAPPPLLTESGLALDDAGYARVDAQLRSTSHPQVFVTGDSASFPKPLPKSGVYAVRQGPVLAANLKRALVGRPLKDYVPQEKTLYLISCGRKYAIASRGDWSAEGRWAWHCKDWIDRRWMARFQ